MRYWGTAAGGPKAECDGEPCCDGPLLRLDRCLNRDLGEFVFRRKDYARLQPAAARMELYRLGLVAPAQYTCWIPDDQRLLLWPAVAEFVTGVHCNRDVNAWVLWAHDVCEIVGEFALYACLRVVGPPP